MANLSITSISKSYGAVMAVDDVTLEVGDGEFFTLLGPSGCGKSTLLAMLAGLEVPDAGRVRVGDKVFSDHADGKFLPPERRDCGLVFQSYALWPHMTVADNLEFGLKVRHVPRAERITRIQDVLKTVGLSRHGERYPHELSGGQQQRAALARTLVSRPSVLLLDEPLSNLDAKLREQARQWLRDIHDQVGVTTIYVTHDQEEALALSTRVAVLDGGRVQQVTEPVTLYERPATRLVAEFVGTTHFVQAEVLQRRADQVVLRPHGGEGTWHFSTEAAAEHGEPFKRGSQVEVAVRPQTLHLSEPLDPNAPLGDDQVECSIESIAYVGGAYLHTILIGHSRVNVIHGNRIVGPRARVSMTLSNPPMFRVAGEDAPLEVPEEPPSAPSRGEKYDTTVSRF